MAHGDQRRRELAAFLKSRREASDPAEYGLPSGRRRGPGLRREELAMLAGVSPTWYTYLEQARDINPSSEVIQSLGRVLRLPASEQRHLAALASRDPGPTPSELASDNDTLRVVLDRFEPWPAYLTGPLSNILLWNDAAVSWYTDFDAIPLHRNLLFWMLTAAEARERLVDWEAETRDVMARVRGACVSMLEDPHVSATLEELRAHSPLMRSWWTEQAVEGPQRRVRRFRHPVHGVRDLSVCVFHWGEDLTTRLVLHVPIDDPDGPNVNPALGL
jgi:transcriptional regulator with XRE-family HTH domain